MGRDGVLKDRKGWGDKGSEGMGIIRDRKGWEMLEDWG